ncbi:hypothetical protein [Iningainema tapete]|uniref:Glutathione S-transferase n=1 Tax=Iningainema tapete BLCC-T55 TaxID=2748662 RepID=A0A8J7C6J7_9CYAN|nr:hypothetical protein [Iningainema tapete]MBD2774419.1 hypothetical protein [Iningainema tapete BLCC-T55]
MVGEKKAKYLSRLKISTIAGILVVKIASNSGSVLALPPPEDTPEEILRTEIITAARSPVDGKPLTAAEYIQLQGQLQKRPTPTLNTKIRENIFLLRLRKTLLQLFPFLDL